jgi:hypothetical protein
MKRNLYVGAILKLNFKKFCQAAFVPKIYQEPILRLPNLQLLRQRCLQQARPFLKVEENI